MIEQCGCDNRRLYRLLNGLLKRRKSHSLAVTNNIHELTSRFSTFFSEKFETIRVAFQSHSTLPSSSTTDHHPVPWLSRLELLPTATTSDIHSLLIKSPTTSCVLDPLPTWLLKDVSDNVVPFLTKLINASIASGVVPCCLKHANVTPEPKKANIDQDNMSSYRPIRNPFVSKLLERYVARCLLDHITANTLLERHQSAYKSHYSTETALVMVQYDILGALDRRYGVILVLLDMSAAFDTVNHEILLSRLEHRYGMAGSMLASMRSYITPSPTGRNIGVIFDTEMSMVSHVKHVCCTPYYHLRKIASIRSCLTKKAAVRLAYSLVISRIDHSNCLLYDLLQCLISKLQRVQNAVARLVVRCTDANILHQFS